MFIDFFHQLKANKVPVGLNEYLTWLDALRQGCSHSNMIDFYYVTRALLVKSENNFDRFDQVFATYFEGKEFHPDFNDQLEEWLKNAIEKRNFTPEELTNLKEHDLDELRKMLEERLKEQKERHDGGNKWIGTGGTSPFGHGGYNPAGIRIGGQGGNRSAVQIASERRFQNYRSDRILDVRQIKMALKKLRKWTKEGNPDELSIHSTIDQTCRNGGDIELVFEHSRRNNIRILMLMDVGGTMDPFVQLVENLFSALHASTHFKDFRHYYFHNCIYDKVYPTAELRQGIPTDELFRKFNEEYRLIIVGDAAMSPYELFSAGGIINYFEHNPSPGIEWLKRVSDHFHKSVWINPEQMKYWDWTETNRVIRQIYSMFPLTLEGLDDAVKELR